MELNHTDAAVLPPGFRVDTNDSRILCVAMNLASEGADVVLVTKDLPLRVKASVLGLPAEEYQALSSVDTGFSGMAELTVAQERTWTGSTPASTRRSWRPPTCHATPAWCSQRRGAAPRRSAG